MSLLDIRDKFRGPAASIDEQIESFAIERVPATQRWPIPAISLVLLGNATAMFFFSFGAQQAFLVGWPWMLLPIGYFFFGSKSSGLKRIPFNGTPSSLSQCTSSAVPHRYSPCCGFALDTFVAAPNRAPLLTHRLGNSWKVDCVKR